MAPRTLERGLTASEAKAFYDRYGRRLDRGEAFERKAKRLAASWAACARGERVLEVGVGCGHFLADARERVGADGLVVGVDVSETMLALARDRAAPAGGVCLVRGSALDLPVGDGCFDLVFSSYLLDLLPAASLPHVLAELRRALKPEGRLVLCGLTCGQTLLERAVMGLWTRIWARDPARVGGCRPLRLLEPARAAGFTIERHTHVGQLGVPSEVLLARPGGPDGSAATPAAFVSRRASG